MAPVQEKNKTYLVFPLQIEKYDLHWGKKKVTVSARLSALVVCYCFLTFIYYLFRWKISFKDLDGHQN